LRKLTLRALQRIVGTMLALLALALIAGIL
jgi:hypothetical protein